jgi:acyl-CoA synthetase (AMP-forming)/AMP-acid ligase II
MTVAEFTSFIEVFRSHVEASPDRPAMTYWQDSDQREQDRTATYAELDRAARSRAAWLQANYRPGDRALLLHPPGPEFMNAFLGCLYAGMVPVPAPPPGADRSQVDRTAGIAVDADVSVILTTSPLAQVIREHLTGLRIPGRPQVVASDRDASADPAAWIHRRPSPDALAFLQYTSGSSSEPKGVMVTHGNLAHHQGEIQRRLSTDRDSVTAGWLPHFHDMGLIGQLLHPVYVGGSVVFMAPTTFLKRPVRWLEAITRCRASLTVAPDFAYDLCARTITDEQLARLDLSSLRCALNGAEPVRATTLDRFNRRFRPVGFRPAAFSPCYGMAEVTLMATARVPDAPVTPYPADPLALAHGEVRPGTAGQCNRLVGCGTAINLDLRIVDPHERTVLEPGRIGEIWISGQSVAAGYWNRPDITAQIFQAYTAGGEGPYLRTGDLGTLLDDELYVTGRHKDVLIVHGRNLYPQDIEHFVREIHPALTAGAGAAFPVSDGREHMVIVQETKNVLLDGCGLAELAARIKVAVARSLDVPAPSVVLTNRGAVRRTTSGKVRRQHMRTLFLADQLKVTHEDLTPAVQALRRRTSPGTDRDRVAARPGPGGGPPATEGTA